MPMQTNELEKYYQVPSKPLAEFNITNDKVYTQTLSDDNIDINFGQVAKLNEIPLATTQDTGGFKLYTEDDGSGTATISQLGKKYGIQIRPEDGVGFVYVPWKNTIYQADPDNYLCAQCVSEENGQDGGLFYFGISCVPVTLITGAGDMLSGEHSRYDKVSADISKPLQDNIDAANELAARNLHSHNLENSRDFTNVHLSIESMSADLDADFYRKESTSSDIELNSQFVGLSADFIKYLNNTLCTENGNYLHTNPAYLSTETSSWLELKNMFESLSNTICADYMYKYESYLCSETSSKFELDNMFNTKQDKLSVNQSISRTGNYGNNDIASVPAISTYLRDQLTEHLAIFQGHFDSLTAVPADKNSPLYTQPPDFNDYIFVNVTDSDIRTAGFNFTTKDVGVWRMKIATSQWDDNKGRQNWVPEYKISDSAFTPAQLAAMNSGINAGLVSLIMSYAAIRNRLVSEFPNMTTAFGKLALLDKIVDNITGSGKAGQVAVFNSANGITGIQFAPTKEKWRFELQDGTSYVEKYILTESV